MKSKPNHVLIVGVNINKQDAHIAYKRGEVSRVAHGVYFPIKQQDPALFHSVGIRLAKYFFPRAALTHISAWNKKVKNDRVFVGGDYPYKKQLIVNGHTFYIIQGMVHPQLDNQDLYTLHTIQDSLGSFTIPCATPELILIQQMDATKQNRERHLDPTEEAELLRFLLTKYNSRNVLLAALEGIANAAGKHNQFGRLVKQFFPLRNRLEIIESLR